MVWTKYIGPIDARQQLRRDLGPATALARHTVVGSKASGPLPALGTWNTAVDNRAPAAARLFSTARRSRLPSNKSQAEAPPPPPRLTHVSGSGAAHMVSVAAKQATARIATAACTVRFSSRTAASLIRADQSRKGDVLGVARVAGIMAAKRTASLIPLCHPVAISHVAVDLDVAEGDEAVEVRATVECDGKTGVEMEALTAAAAAALTVYDMCKAVDKGMRIEGLRVVLKDGGRSGRWAEGEGEGEGEGGPEA